MCVIILKDIKMSEFKDYCIRVFNNLHPRSTFLSIRNYKNNFNEVSNFSVVFHANYFNAVKKAQNIVKSSYYSKNNFFSEKDLILAKDELLDSFKMTLSGYNPLYTCQGIYKEIIGSNNKPIPGIKLHIRQDIVHIHALRINKKIISSGSYPKHNSSPKTQAKKYLRNLTPLGSWVQFKLEPKRFNSLAVEKMILKG